MAFGRRQVLGPAPVIRGKAAAAGEPDCAAGAGRQGAAVETPAPRERPSSGRGAKVSTDMAHPPDGRGACAAAHALAATRPFLRPWTCAAIGLGLLC